MDVLSKTALNELITFRNPSCVSIFLPTVRSGKDREQNPIRMKNLLRRAEKLLTENGLRSSAAKDILAPAQRLLVDLNFWRYPGDGMAFFFNHGFFRYYQVPITTEQSVAVSDHFHVTPLLPLFMVDGRFYVLAVSKKHLKLFEGTRGSIRQVDLTNVPTHIQDYLKYSDPEEQLRYHSVGVAATASATAIFHGQGIGTDDAVRKKDILEFFRMVDRNLRRKLNGDRIPMILAGVEYERSLFREACDYPNILDDGIGGSPDSMTDAQIHDRGWAIAEPQFRQSLDEARRLFHQGINTSRVSQNLETILHASLDGRVEILFIARGLSRWGTFDPKTRRLEAHPTPQPGDENLQDLATIYTFSSGGAVYYLDPRDAPIREPLAAVFRY